MVAKKRKGILKRGIRRGEQGINPLLVALGAGAGAAGGAGMGARRAMQTAARVPKVASKMAKDANRDFAAYRDSESYYGRKAEDFKQVGDMVRYKQERSYRRVPGEDLGRMFRADAEAREQGGFRDRAGAAARKIQRSGRMDPMRNQNRIEDKLAAVGNKASTRRTKRMAGKGAIKGGVLAALAQAVLAEMNKKKG
jgi:hypothetical protein